MSSYDKVNWAWKLTCKAVLGEEIGDLKDYEEWLKEYVAPIRVEKSAINDEDVYLAIPGYCKRAKFIPFPEVDFRKKYGPLNINEIKDIDSIVEAVRERIYYAGSVVLGTSQSVEKSSNVIDSFYVYNSSKVSDSKYVACSNMVRYGQYLFGYSNSGESRYCIKCSIDHGNSRCFECHTPVDCQDSYFSTMIKGCADVMFSFGAVGKRYLIGNLELPGEKYLQIKNKLIAEVREILKKDKRIFSVYDLIEQAEEPTFKLDVPSTREKGDMAPINRAFSKITSVVLGKSFPDITEYEKFLQRHVAPIIISKSPLSGKKVIAATYVPKLVDNPRLARRLIAEDEMWKIGKMSIKEEALENLSMDLEKLAQTLSDISFFTLDIRVGSNLNIVDAVIVMDSENCYKGTDYVYSKKCGICVWPRESDHVFGSTLACASSFCLKSHYSKKLSRCFEVDSCENCSDLYYSHNCENVHDSMFCFNVKNLRNAVGNAPLAPGEYKKIKQSVLEQLAAELEKKKDLKWDIYNIGCPKK